MTRHAIALLAGVFLAACAGTDTTAPELRQLQAVVPESGIITQDNDLVPDPETCQAEWHWVINGLADAGDAPAFITVYFAGAGEQDIPLENVTGGTAHYRTSDYLDDVLTGVGAEAEMAPGTQYNRFNLSHGPCQFQACSPGYWGATNPRKGIIIHEASWPIDLATPFEDYFDLPANKAAGWTLYQALQEPGSTPHNAAFIGTAALLSVLSGDVSYQYSQAEVVAAVNAALAGDPGSADPSIFDLAATFGEGHICPLP